MSARNRSLLTRIAALALALGLPGLFALDLVRAAGAPAARLAAGVLEGPMLLAQATPAASADRPVALTATDALVTGVLYTRGKADVSWNGTRFEVNDGSYAYVGGETVSMAPEGVGVLKLPGGGTVFLCGGSSATLTRGPAGRYDLEVARGSARMQMPAGQDFTIAASDVVLAPVPRTASPGGQVEAEVKAQPDGGCVVCELASGVALTVAGAPAAPGPIGRIVEVAAPGSTNRVTQQPIPPAVLQAAAPGQGSSNPPFLCRCEEMRDEPETRPEDETRLAEADTEADGQADTATAAEEAALVAAGPETAPPGTGDQPAEPPRPGADPVADGTPPPVLPPDAPPLAVADSEPPDPFDPNVLPPPAAGEPPDPVVFVSPPGVPGFGSGGGGGVETTGGGGGGPAASPS